MGEESDFPVDPIWIVSIVLIIGLGSSAAYLLNQKSKGAFGGSGQQTEDYSDEWAGMEGNSAAVPQMAPPQAPPAAAPPQAPPAAAPPQAPPAAVPPVAPPTPTLLTITVPEGVMAGQQIQIKAPSGQLVNVKVPEGCGPGSQFKIQI